MIKIKYPLEVKYVDSMEKEVVVLSLTSQGKEIDERQSVKLILQLLKNENLDSILIYNPEKFDTFYLKKGIVEKISNAIFNLQVEERTSYEI